MPWFWQRWCVCLRNPSISTFGITAGQLQAQFDVFNALTLHDNPLFFHQLKFGAGDGCLNFYLFNYRCAPIAGGLNEKNLPDESRRGGVGIVLLWVEARVDGDSIRLCRQTRQ